MNNELLAPDMPNEGAGYWNSCSGCHGIGCRECGGLGVVWTETKSIARAEQKPWRTKEEENDYSDELKGE